METEGDLIGKVQYGPSAEEPDTDAFTMCLDCANDTDCPDGKVRQDLRDQGAFGAEVPYPECHLCGCVIRPD